MHCYYEITYHTILFNASSLSVIDVARHGSLKCKKKMIFMLLSKNKYQINNFNLIEQLIRCLPVPHIIKYPPFQIIFLLQMFSCFFQHKNNLGTKFDSQMQFLLLLFIIVSVNYMIHAALHCIYHEFGRIILDLDLKRWKIWSNFSILAYTCPVSFFPKNIMIFFFHLK